MKIYHYDPVTHEYTGQSVASLDPIGRKPMIPAYAVQAAPPAAAVNKIAVWKKSAWVLVDDYRGSVFFDATGARYTINDIGMAPDPTWTQTRPFVLKDAKNTKKQQIKTAFETAIKQPVIDTNNVAWEGGYDSAMRLDAAKRLAQLSAAAQVTFFDHSNVAHTLTIADAETVILRVGADYQAKFTKKQSLMTQVDALPGTATQADLDAITVTY